MGPLSGPQKKQPRPQRGAQFLTSSTIPQNKILSRGLVTFFEDFFSRLLSITWRRKNKADLPAENEEDVRNDVSRRSESMHPSAGSLLSSCSYTGLLESNHEPAWWVAR